MHCVDFLNCVDTVDIIFCLLLQFVVIIVDGQNLSNRKRGKNLLNLGIKKPLKIKGSDTLKLMRKKQMFFPLLETNYNARGYIYIYLRCRGYALKSGSPSYILGASAEL